MSDRRNKYDLQIKSVLHNFLENEVLPGTQVEADDFWFSLREIISDFSPINKQLLDERIKLQKELDQWHIKNPGPKFRSTTKSKSNSKSKAKLQIRSFPNREGLRGNADILNLVGQG